MLIKDTGIDRRNREERRRRTSNRRQEDIRSGLTMSNTPQRGDYPLCRDLDKTLKDFHKFKDPKDRAKIKKEYFGKQSEFKSKVLSK